MPLGAPGCDVVFTPARRAMMSRAFLRMAVEFLVAFDGLDVNIPAFSQSLPRDKNILFRVSFQPRRSKCPCFKIANHTWW